MLPTENCVLGEFVLILVQAVAQEVGLAIDSQSE